MHETSYAKMGSFVDRYLTEYSENPLQIVDIGAQSVLGHKTYRDLFEAQSWCFVGLDIEPGVNVDLVVRDPYSWNNVDSGSFDVAISGQALEHVEFPWKTFSEVFRVLRPGGLFCLIVPSSGEEHRYPVDCWRYYPDSMRALARDSGFSVVEVFTDFGLGNWQDTCAVFQKPFMDKEDAAALSPFVMFDDRGAAFSEYHKALSTRPKNPAYYVNLGRLLRHGGMHDDANVAYRVGVEVFPNHLPLRIEVAKSLHSKGEVVAAAEHCLVMMGMRPINQASIECFGPIFESLSENQRDYYAKLLPVEPQPLRRLASLAHEGGHYRLAASCWASLKIIEPADTSIEERRCLALWGAGDEEKSRSGFINLCRSGMMKGEINRASVIQRFIDKSSKKSILYLEIGVEQGLNFLQVEAGAKFAVDPAFKIPGGAKDFDRHRFFETTSDSFFESVPPEIVEHGIDIALVDGLHTYDQALRDVENCLRYLAPGGLIVMHDCLPASEIEAAPSLQAAQSMPGYRQAWTGDVYKAVVHLRASRPDLFVAVVGCDHGIGLVRKGDPESMLDIEVEQIDELSFDELSKSPESWLNLKSEEWYNNHFQ